MIQYEYASCNEIELMSEEDLDSFGLDGWELVNFIYAKSEFIYIFKRDLNWYEPTDTEVIKETTIESYLKTKIIL